MTIFWVDPNDGQLLRATPDNAPSPQPDAVPVVTPPKKGTQRWDGNQWTPEEIGPTDPDAELREAIEAANTVAQLKEALLGHVGKVGRVASRPL